MRQWQIDACPSYQLEGEPVWESACPGYENWSVFFRASEHGSGISYAFNGSERTDFYRPPAQLLFGNFHNTIEWRMDAEGVYATIHRYISEGPNMDADPNETEEPAGEPGRGANRGGDAEPDEAHAGGALRRSMKRPRLR